MIVGGFGLAVILVSIMAFEAGAGLSFAKRRSNINEVLISEEKKE